MNFSILLPARKKTKYLRLATESIFKTAKDMSKIEILFGIDDDDLIIREEIDKIIQEYPDYAIYYHSLPRTNSIIKILNNLAVSYSKGKYILAGNIDALFRSNNWDVLCYNRLEEYLKHKPDRIVYGITQDLEMYRNKDMFWEITDFPIISREAIKTLGFVMDPRYVLCGADDDIAKLYGLIGRTLDLRDICIIEHWAKEFDALNEIVYPELLPENANKKELYADWVEKSLSPTISVNDERIFKLINYITEVWQWYYHNNEGYKKYFL